MPGIDDKKGIKDLTDQLETQNQRLEDYLLKERQERTSLEESVEALRRSEDLHRLIFENVRDFAIFFADLEGRIVRWNPGAERFFGYAESEVLGQSMEILYTPEDRSNGIAERERTLAAQTGASSDERWHLRKDGTRFFVFGVVNALHDDEGRLRGFVKIARDITERKKAQENLEAEVSKRTKELNEKVIELEAFSYSLSHDMRAPVRAIQSFCELARAEVAQKVGPPATVYLDRARAAAQRLDRLIQDVLALSHLSHQELKLEAIDTETLVRQIIQERPEFQEPNAHLALRSPLQPVMGQQASLGQCITNLLDNAVKFVSQGVKPQIGIWTEPAEGQVRLHIEDNGIGIDEQGQQRLFQMFSRIHSGNDYAGTGIGLAIVRKAAERMGGQVGVESQPGHGSRFWLQLPKTNQ